MELLRRQSEIIQLGCQFAMYQVALNDFAQFSNAVGKCAQLRAVGPPSCHRSVLFVVVPQIFHCLSFAEFRAADSDVRRTRRPDSATPRAVLQIGRGSSAPYNSQNYSASGSTIGRRLPIPARLVSAQRAGIISHALSPIPYRWWYKGWPRYEVWMRLKWSPSKLAKYRSCRPGPPNAQFVGKNSFSPLGSSISVLHLPSLFT